MPRKEWESTGAIGVAAVFLGVAPEQKDVTYELFVEVALAFVEAEIVAPNPVVASAIAFVAAVAPTDPGSDRPWAARLLRAGLAARLPVQVAQDGNAFDAISEVPSADAADAFKATKEFLSFLPKSALEPAAPWFLKWKASREEEKERAKQARGKAKDDETAKAQEAEPQRGAGPGGTDDGVVPEVGASFFLQATTPNLKNPNALTP